MSILPKRMEFLDIDYDILGLEVYRFTPREIQVLSCLQRGKGNKEIASILNISPKTVSTHVQKVLTKTGLHSREKVEDIVDYKNCFEQLDIIYQQLKKCNPITDPAPSPPANIAKERQRKKRLKKRINFFTLSTIIIGLIMTVGTAINFANLKISNVLLQPNTNEFLQRESTYKKINNSLSTQSTSVKIVALVGIGGSGKTTIARQYTLKSNSKIKWEINAETQETLILSFFCLAENCAKDKERKERLEKIKALSTPDERLKQVMVFIQQQLKNEKNWFLVFDNVETRSEIYKKISSYTEQWGTGTILLTSRDSQLNVLQASQIIPVNELTHFEATQLFSKIVDREPVISTDKSALNHFIEQLPPFPLDVSTAAYYIRNFKISFDCYLQRMREASKKFNCLQKKIRASVNDYDLTRQNILSMTFEQILKIDKNFIKPLLLLGLVNSQNISTALIEAEIGSINMDAFVHVVKEHSLVTFNDQEIFIHRSIQEGIIKFIQQHHGSMMKQYINQICLSFFNFSDQLIENINVDQMRNQMCHILSLLRHKKLIDSKNQAKLEFQFGRISYYLGDIHNAYSYLESSLQLLPTTQATDVALCLTYLGAINRQLGNYQSAKANLLKSVDIFNQTSDKKNNNINLSLLHLGNVLTHIGDYEEAKQALEQSISGYKKNNKGKHSNVALAYSYLGDLYRLSGNDKKASQKYEKAKNIYMSLYDCRHSRTAWITLRLGIAQKHLGQYQAAHQSMKIAYKTYENHLPDHEDSIYWVSARLGDMERVMGNYSEAKKLLERSYKGYVQLYGKNHMKTAWTGMFLGELYIDLCDFDKATTVLKNCFLTYEQHFKKDHINWDQINYQLAKLTMHKKEYQKAEKLFLEVQAGFKKKLGENHWEFSLLLKDIGYLHYRNQNFEQSEKLLLLALALYKKNHHPEIYRCHECLAEMYSVQGSKLKSVEHYKKALHIATRNFPKNSAHIIRLQQALNKVGTA